MKFLKELEKRVLYIIGGVVALGIGIMLIIFSFSSTANDKDDTGIAVKVGVVAAIIGGGCIFIGFTSKKKFESITSEDPSPEEKGEPQPLQQNEKKPPPLP